MATNKKKVVSLAALVIGILIIVMLARTPTDCHNFTQSEVVVDGQTIPVAVAIEPGERQRGLSGCEEVPEGHGMYFVFEESQPAIFWMKDMLIPIDIVWIADGTVLGVERDVPPPTSGEELERYFSPEPVDGVLELAAGGAAAIGLEEGSRAELQK